jgi:hypothetical protein
MLIVDTNVLVDVLGNDPEWADWSIRQLRSQAQVHELAITPVIYAELSLTFESVASLDSAVAGMQLTMTEPTRDALFLAGKAYVKYRRSGGGKHNVLADFFIGAQAAVSRCGILTRDPKRYRNYFPGVPLVTP